MLPAPRGLPKPSRQLDCNRPCLSFRCCRCCWPWCCTADRGPSRRICGRERLIESEARMQVDDVKRSIGKEAGVSGWLDISQNLIDDFAKLTGDRQWIHVDTERARRESPFGATVAHGFLTVALLSRLVAEAVDLRADSKLRVNYGFNRLRFPAPVPAGARIRARVTPNAVRDV